jgi:glutamate-5-semialdehyde dehydrogenase
MSLTNALPADAAKAAKSASHTLAILPTSARNDALIAIHTALSQSKDEILAANARDLALARKAAEDGKLSLSIVSRLDLGKKGKWEDMLKGISDVRELEDPGMANLYLYMVLAEYGNSWQSYIKNEA